MNQALFRRYVPLLVGMVALLTLLVIPLKIIGTGYLPVDDALRHAAKMVSGKPWSVIVVMREGFPMNHHAGWHTVLGWVHAGLRCADGQALSPNTAPALAVGGFALTLLAFVYSPADYVERFLRGYANIVFRPGFFPATARERTFTIHSA